MKKIKNYQFVILSAFLVLFFSSCHKQISVEINAPGGGVIKDAILIVSDNGNPPRETYVLGDIDLSETLFTFSHTVDTLKYTHWWLIGSLNGNVVYSSVLPLNGVNMYTIEPYIIERPEFAWDIPNNLAGYASKQGFSNDWWAQTINNYSSHVAANKAMDTLWMFNNGSFLGTIKIDLKKD